MTTHTLGARINVAGVFHVLKLTYDIGDDEAEDVMASDPYQQAGLIS